MGEIIDIRDWLRRKVAELKAKPKVVGEWATYEAKDGKPTGEPLETGLMYDGPVCHILPYVDLEEPEGKEQ